jgi:hypothetical protein
VRERKSKEGNYGKQKGAKEEEEDETFTRFLKLSWREALFFPEEQFILSMLSLLEIVYYGDTLLNFFFFTISPTLHLFILIMCLI